MTLIQVDMSGVLDAPWSARRAGKVGRNPEPLEALERLRDEAIAAYAARQAAYAAWLEVDDAADDALEPARRAGWSLARIADAAGLSIRDPRIRALRDLDGDA